MNNLTLWRRPASQVGFSRGFLADFERFADTFWNNERLFDWGPRLAVLRIYDEQDDLVVRAEIPGFAEDKIEITLEGRALKVEAERENGEEGAEHGHYYGSVLLPYAVDAEKVSATLKEGLLEIRLPKPDELKPKHIKVKALKEPKPKKKKARGKEN